MEEKNIADHILQRFLKEFKEKSEVVIQKYSEEFENVKIKFKK
jgi:hypothetical protein